MRQRFNILALIGAAYVLTACATSGDMRANHLMANIPATESETEDSLNGHWEGVLTTKDPEPGQMVLRLELDASTIKVFEKNKISGAWLDIMPNHFRGSVFRGNAVIDGTHFGNDEDGRWVETWVLVVTCKSRNELQAEWVRMVNNVDLPSSNLEKTFSSGAAGVLKRTNDF